MGTLHEGQHRFLIITRLFPLRIRNVSNKSHTEKSNNVFYVQKLFRNSCPSYDNVEKHCTARKATDDHTTRVQYMLDN